MPSHNPQHRGFINAVLLCILLIFALLVLSCADAAFATKPGPGLHPLPRLLENLQ